MSCLLRCKASADSGAHAQCEVLLCMKQACFCPMFVCWADGRHYKHFHLVDANSGHERLAVVGEDSARQDRRYTYKALEDVGGYCFENGKAVSRIVPIAD